MTYEEFVMQTIDDADSGNYGLDIAIWDLLENKRPDIYNDVKDLGWSLAGLYQEIRDQWDKPRRYSVDVRVFAEAKNADEAWKAVYNKLATTVGGEWEMLSNSVRIDL